MLAVLKLDANVDALYTPDGILSTMHYWGRFFSVCVVLLSFYNILGLQFLLVVFMLVLPDLTHFADMCIPPPSLKIQF